jgi:hypothetical protein
MYFRVKLFNPDRASGWIEPILRPILNPVGLPRLARAGAVRGARVLVPHWGELVRLRLRGVAPSNWGWMGRLRRNQAHPRDRARRDLQALRRAGARVRRDDARAPPIALRRRVGVLGLREQVAAHGGRRGRHDLRALRRADRGVRVARQTPEGSHSTSSRTTPCSLSGVSTVLFNANPLMRFDGYYILSDLLEVPNLMQRPISMLNHLFQKYIYRIKNGAVPPSVPGERRSSRLRRAGDGVPHVPVRLHHALRHGQALRARAHPGVWTAAMWFIMPVGKFVHWLATSPSAGASFAGAIAGQSRRLSAATLLLVGVIPMPDHRPRGRARERPVHRRRSSVPDGFVTRSHVRPGQLREEGRAIVTMRERSSWSRSGGRRLAVEERSAETRAWPATSRSAGRLATRAGAPRARWP